MQCRVHDIIPPLKPFITAIWSAEENENISGEASMRVLPNTLIELDINFSTPYEVTLPGKSTSSHATALITQMQRYMDIRTQNNFGLISVFFSEASAFYFFGLPLKEVAGDITALDAIWKHLAGEMHERILAARTIGRKVEIVQQYLLKKLPGDSVPDKLISYCVEEVHNAKGQIDISDLADKTGLSNRQLLRRFDNFVGISPKELVRKVRFMNAVQSLKKNEFRNLTDLTYNSGYYDQAHFIHDFREYAGMTPGEFLGSASIIY